KYGKVAIPASCAVENLADEAEACGPKSLVSYLEVRQRGDDFDQWEKDFLNEFSRLNHIKLASQEHYLYTLFNLFVETRDYKNLQALLTRNKLYLFTIRS